MAASRKRKLRTLVSQAGTPESQEGTPREPASCSNCWRRTHLAWASFPQ
jgi:hypothetical protein